MLCSVNFKKYSRIDEVISSLECRKLAKAKKVYQQTLTTHIGFDELGMRTVAPNFEKMICDNDEACQIIDRRIDEWKMRKDFFNRFLASLSIKERRCLNDIMRLSEEQQDELEPNDEMFKIYERTLIEIDEIERAISLKRRWEILEKSINDEKNRA